MENNELVQLKEKFRGKSILIVGDVMLDRYIQGRVNRISPEAPVPILEWRTSEDRLGGAANVAVNCLAMGAQVNLVSIAGADDEGKRLQEGLRNAGIRDYYIHFSTERRTTTKTRVMAAQQHLLRMDAEDTRYLSPSEASTVLGLWQDAWDKNHPDLVIIQDYDKGLLDKGFIDRIIQQCKHAHVPVIVDPKRRQFWDYQEVTLFKPNLKELSEAIGYPVQPRPEAVAEAISLLRSRLRPANVLVTLGAHGMYLEGEVAQLIAPVPVELTDVCGAGDTVISVLAVAMAAGLPIAEAAELANRGAAWVCTQPGVVPVQWEAWR